MHMSPAAALEAQRLLELCPKHSVTPLYTLPRLAQRLDVAQVRVKDESERLGLGSFKALGGAYALLRVFLRDASKRLGREVLATELADPALRAIAKDVVFACATDGNHGRSVAAGAHFVGCQAVIFLHEGVSAARAAAIERFGASIRYVRGSYDDAVIAAARMSEEHGWHVISDTSWPGYESIPRLVAQGYTTMLREVEREIGQPPTHIFVQAGVGGLAAAVAAYFALAYGESRPKVVVVEPERAACIYASHEAGRLVAIPRGQPTVMAMLECYEPSLVAWNVLSRLADAFMTVTETDAVRAMRQFAEPLDGDVSIVAGESGAAGLAGLMSARQSESMSAALQLDAHSRVLLINTEGATDPEAYARLVGRTPEQVRN
jgi:diaminopropionate ammonia-lyase